MTRPRQTDPAPDRQGSSRELEEMWESLLLSGWNSLAIVPADHGTSVARVTAAFEIVSARRGGRDPRLLDASGSTVPDGERMAKELTAMVAAGDRVVVVVDSVMRSLAGIPLIRAVEEVLLVLCVGNGDPEGLSSTADIVGPNRIIGSVAVPQDP